jgi:hypothetical protein
MSKTAVVKSRTRPAESATRSGAGGARRNSLSGVIWRLPSGEGLAEFALRFGFLAPSLLGAPASAIPARSRRQEARG